MARIQTTGGARSICRTVADRLLASGPRVLVLDKRSRPGAQPALQWVAHFVLKSMADERVTIYGDAMEVREASFIDDLAEALLAAHARSDLTAGPTVMRGDRAPRFAVRAS